MHSLDLRALPHQRDSPTTVEALGSSMRCALCQLEEVALRVNHWVLQLLSMMSMPYKKCTCEICCATLLHSCIVTLHSL